MSGSRLRQGVGSVSTLLAGGFVVLALSGMVAWQLPDAAAHSERAREASALKADIVGATDALGAADEELQTGRVSLDRINAHVARTETRVADQRKGLTRLRRQFEALDARLEELGG